MEFRHLFIGSGRRDGGNDWYDVGRVQVPITNGVEWKFDALVGENVYGDGQPWNRFSPPEGVRLSAQQLPSHEHGMYLNEAGFTYHLFGDGAWYVTYSLPIVLSGEYQFGVELYGDWVDIVDGRKQSKPDPHHAQISFGYGNWIDLNKSGSNTVSSILRASEPVSFTILTRYAKGGGKGANGCFIKRIWLKQQTAKFAVCYNQALSLDRRLEMVRTYPDAVAYTSDRSLVGSYVVVEFQ